MDSGWRWSDFLVNFVEFLNSFQKPIILMHSKLPRELAGSFATVALSHVTREYPGKMDHVVAGPADIASPRALHPTFYGSFDWHSCVHGFWLLAKIGDLFPDLPQVANIRALFDAQLTPDKIAGELSYLQRPGQENFERPYGWAWLLMLASQLARHKATEANIWYQHLQPLARLLAQRFKQYLAKLPFPIRAGTHPNTAFAAALAIDYAETCEDADLLVTVQTRMRTFFGSDVDCRPSEPNGNDFHSPLLIEMEGMRRALDHSDFLNWADRFLPQIAKREPHILFEPIAATDQADPHTVHLVGLNFSRAWCWRRFAAALPNTDVRRKIAMDAAEAHIVASLPHVAGDYMGEHWLATYATLALTA
jgi:Protein of unknown function (DUF2891)